MASLAKNDTISKIGHPLLRTICGTRQNIIDSNIKIAHTNKELNISYG